MIKDQDPREVRIKETLSKIETIDSPTIIIDDSAIPEFGIDATQRKIAIKVGQGRMASSLELPLRSDWVANCQLLVLKTPVDVNRDLFTLIHLWAGDFDLNLPGARLEDVQDLANKQTTAFFVTGDRNPYPVEARSLAYRDIVTTRNIRIHSGRTWFSLVYKLSTNEVLVKVGNPDETGQVQVFQGF